MLFLRVSPSCLVLGQMLNPVMRLRYMFHDLHLLVRCKNFFSSSSNLINCFARVSILYFLKFRANIFFDMDMLGMIIDNMICLDDN